MIPHHLIAPLDRSGRPLDRPDLRSNGSVKPMETQRWAEQIHLELVALREENRQLHAAILRVAAAMEENAKATQQGFKDATALVYRLAAWAATALLGVTGALATKFLDLLGS